MYSQDWINGSSEKSMPWMGEQTWSINLDTGVGGGIVDITVGEIVAVGVTGLVNSGVGRDVVVGLEN
jgi:hypothetical protein